MLEITEQSRIVSMGVIKVPTEYSLGKRLQLLHAEILIVAHTHTPELVVIEEGYCGVDGRSALKLGMVRGALLTAFAGVEVAMYSPSYIKKRVLGKGNASKNETLLWVNQNFPDAQIKSQDIADAVIVGLAGYDEVSVEVV